MIDPAVKASGNEVGFDAHSSTVGDFLSEHRVVIDLDVTSRKKLFEQLAHLVSTDDENLSLDTVMRTLTERERLGCTGLGHGIALPHGRVDGLGEPVIAVVRLKHALNYDAPDGEPIWLAVCLLVPADANETHLKLLAALASRFSDAEFLDQLKQSQTSAELSAYFKTI